jgi:hypothetical protein
MAGGSKRRNFLFPDIELDQPAVQEDSTFEKLCKAIEKEQLIPVIGDTIRLSHIFDVNMNDKLGGDDQDNEENSEDIPPYNVIEQLAQKWAGYIGYPLLDRSRMARVAQFWVLKKKNKRTEAKEGYLDFLKRVLLGFAAAFAKNEGKPELSAAVSELTGKPSISFAEIADELDFPRFEEGKEDPLRILARLPIKIYITTSYFNFIELALEAEGKHPRSKLCLWNKELVEPEHGHEPGFLPDIDTPVVFHLFGMERYPSSMVLTEDDYLRFLWRLAQPPPDDSGQWIIPPYLEDEIMLSSMLLLGYRLQDWDLRMLIHGLLSDDRVKAPNRRTSVAIQIDLKNQPLVADSEEAEEYLINYFENADFHMEFKDADDFVSELWEEWQKWRPAVAKNKDI